MNLINVITLLAISQTIFFSLGSILIIVLIFFLIYFMQTMRNIHKLTSEALIESREIAAETKGLVEKVGDSVLLYTFAKLKKLFNKK